MKLDAAIGAGAGPRRRPERARALCRASGFLWLCPGRATVNGSPRSLGTWSRNARPEVRRGARATAELLGREAAQTPSAARETGAEAHRGRRSASEGLTRPGKVAGVEISGRVRADSVARRRATPGSDTHTTRCGNTKYHDGHQRGGGDGCRDPATGAGRREGQ